MLPSTATATDRDPAAAPRSAPTLLDLVGALSATGATDREVVAAVIDLLESGRVRLLRPVCDEQPGAHPRTTTRRGDG
jgi:hypothetical protein